MTLPLIPIAAQFLGGGLQSLFSGSGAANAALEKLTKESPTYTGGNSISDFYNKALQRYNVNPYTGALYQKTMQNAQRVTNQGLSALQDRRSALGSIGKLLALQNDASLNASVAAENQQQRQLQQLGTASQSKANEEKYQYQQNELNPYLRRLSLAQQKAGGAAATQQAGISNIFGALNSAAMLLDEDKKEQKTPPKTAQYTMPKLSSVLDGVKGGYNNKDVYNGSNEEDDGGNEWASFRDYLNYIKKPKLGKQ